MVGLRWKTTPDEQRRNGSRLRPDAREREAAGDCHRERVPSVCTEPGATAMAAGRLVVRRGEPRALPCLSASLHVSPSSIGATLPRVGV
jgi:hypothetical protein